MTQRSNSTAADLVVNDPELEETVEDYSGEPEEGVALCLSGGGYRAMLFHAGALIRLNDLGLLPKLSRISSVSGGSITAGVLGLAWKQLNFNAKSQATNLMELVIEPIQQMASTSIDRQSIIGGFFLPGSASDRIVAAYKEHLFGAATLQDLPDDDEGPRFVFNATNVQSGALLRMSKPYLADYRVGMIRFPKIQLAEVVAASSAFPPLLSPAVIEVDPDDFEPDEKCDLQREPFTDTLVLSDGGVYDNLGLETAWKRYQTVLVSDGGAKMSPDPEPAGDWARHSKRIIDIMGDQVVSLRTRQLINSFKKGDRAGAYWGIRTNIKHYQLEDCFKVCPKVSQDLATTPTRLKRLPQRRQQQLMNWGFAVSDAACRKHASQLIGSALHTSPANYPFPEAGLE